MDPFAIYNDLEECKADENFLQYQLLVSTDCKDKDIDILYEYCSRESYMYSIYRYDFNSDFNFTPEKQQVIGNEIKNLIRNEKIERALKINCVISALYTCLSIKEKSNFIPFNNMVKDLHSEKLLTKERDKANYLFDSMLTDSYLNSFALIKKIDGKRMVSNLCNELTLDLIFNHQNESENKFGNISRFALDNYLKGLTPTDKNNRGIMSDKAKRMKEYNLKKNLKQKVIDIITGLELVNNEWKSQGDIIDQIVFEYRKEFIFHQNAILSFISNYNSSQYDQDILEFIYKMRTAAEIPIIYGLEDIISIMPSVLYTNALQTIKISIPIILKTFFITLVKRYEGNINACIDVLTEYIIMNYQNNIILRKELSPNNIKNQSDFINDMDMLRMRRFADVILYIYKIRDNFPLYKEFKMMDSIRKTDSKLSLQDIQLANSMDYEMFIRKETLIRLSSSTNIDFNLDF